MIIQGFLHTQSIFLFHNTQRQKTNNFHFFYEKHRSIGNKKKPYYTINHIKYQIKRIGEFQTHEVQQLMPS